MSTNYYLGLDMGTSSVGWAVTDNQYNLIRKNGKDLWGIREFEKADTAADRRMHRISRRGNQRNHVRIGLINDYFADEIAKVDKNFYQRLQNSKYYLEDKDEEVKSKYSIFDDVDYTDADYYSEYPTIFHLRKELIENSNAPYDVRLVYLAVINLFKRRGHFLNASLSIDNDTESVSVIDAYNNLVYILEEVFEEELQLPRSTNDIINKFEEIFVSSDYSRTKRAEIVAETLGVTKREKKKYELIKAICGLNVNYGKLFGIQNTEEKIEAKFSDFGYADKEPEIIDKLGDYAEVLEALKRVYDACTLVAVLGGEKYLSYSRVRDYEKHKEDLKLLKKVIRRHCPDRYDFVFRDTQNGSYSAYVNSVNSNGKTRRRNMSSRSTSDFYAAVKKLLPANSTDKDVLYILKSIESETFMPKQLKASNGVIPNQIHAKELKKILDNASNYLGFLNEIDESGLSVKERIVRLYTFTIPYYIGPTSETSKTGWVVRKEKGKVLPWNIDEKVDRVATSEAFVNRMVRRCTYIADEQVLPKSSLLYERYMVLNEINNIRIDGVRIDNNLKQKMFNEIYKSGKKPSRNKIENWLINNGVHAKEQITGIDRELNSALSTYGKFYSIVGDKINTDTYKRVIDDIVLQCTVHGEQKSLIVEYIKTNYPESDYPDFTDKNIKKIIGFKFKDWGRFSKELLTMQGCMKGTGEVISIIHALWETNHNFMELINSDEYTFRDEIREKEKVLLNSLSEYSPEVLDEFYFSAPVKKMINQTVHIIQEITHIMGDEPERIFIEMTRSDEEKGEAGRKDSRYKQLHELFKNITDELHDKDYWKMLIDKENISGRLKSKKMYLYIKQMGRDMYTGDVIDLDELFNDNKYDIDHIYPRHYVKDDSLENNLVLSNKKMNEEIKKDKYPIPGVIRNNTKVLELWDRLHELKLINDTKYARLKSSMEFTDEQRADFIARQLVETSQATKGVADIINQMMPKAKVVYSKAGLVSRFRADNNLYKTRLINDNHHAQDAYLNIVVGNVYYTKFTDNPLRFIKDEFNKDAQKYNYHLNRMFERRVERNGYVAWRPYGENEAATMETIKKTIDRNTPILTRQSFEKHGVINKVTIYGKDKTKEKGYLPIKTSDSKLCNVKKYGGYTSISIAYYFLVEHEKRGRRIRTIEAMPGYMVDKIRKNPAELDVYCSSILGLKNHRIIIERINIQSLLEINGYRAHLSGRSNDQIVFRNAVSLCLRREWVNYVYAIEKYVSGQNYYEDVVSREKNLELYDIMTSKHLNTIYNKRRPNSCSIGNVLQKGKAKFERLELSEQCKVILEILKCSSVGTEIGNLNLIDKDTTILKMYISKDLREDDQVLLINQSVTGFYENKIDLGKYELENSCN